jgi:hypothetical protein
MCVPNPCQSLNILSGFFPPGFAPGFASEGLPCGTDPPSGGVLCRYRSIARRSRLAAGDGRWVGCSNAGEGEPLTPPAGRADDFVWPRREVGSTSGMASVEPQSKTVGMVHPKRTRQSDRPLNIRGVRRGPGKRSRGNFPGEMSSLRSPAQAETSRRSSSTDGESARRTPNSDRDEESRALPKRFGPMAQLFGPTSGPTGRARLARTWWISWMR